MQTKLLNAYRITHKNGSVENINAENLVEALNNMEIDESYSPVLQTYMVEEGIRTLVADAPSEVPFTSVVNDTAGGSIATPLSGVVHTGDQLSFKAIPARNYVFKNWKMNDVIVSENPEFVFTFPELHGEASAVFKATFEPAPVDWVTAVSPAEATADGAFTFPANGETPADGTVSAVAVASEHYAFDHWERNGVSVGTNKILSVEAEEPAEGEAEVVYTAVFREE